jgi:hypothetical protein
VRTSVEPGQKKVNRNTPSIAFNKSDIPLVHFAAVFWAGKIDFI